MTLADRIVVMRAGRIEQSGTPMEIYHDPVNQFVATFFGSPAMNLIAGVVRRKESGMAFVFDGQHVPLEGVEEVPDGPATLGVRPEGVRVEGVTGGYRARIAGGYPARVALVEPLGKETLVYLDYGAERLLIAVANPSFQLEEGSNIEFDLRGGRLYLFDPEGSRLDRGDSIPPA